MRKRAVEPISRARHPLLRPRWLLAHVVIAGLVATFVLLGLWQLDRHADRRERNEDGAARMAVPPIPLDELLAGVGGDLDAIRYRMVTVTGRYDPPLEVLVRSQIHRGAPGFHVVTPLVTTESAAVLVNRGWVPITMDVPPVEDAEPADSEVSVTGWVELSQARPLFGPADPAEGRLARVNRIDIARISQQVPYDLAPIYLVAVGEGDGLPEEIDPPGFDDTGPHLAYAVQWFGFAIIGIVGYLTLARKQIRQPPGRARSSTTS